MSNINHKQFEMSEDFLPINGTDYVEFYVGNAKQVAYYYQTAFGFQPLAYRGLETGDKQKTSYVLVQDKIRSHHNKKENLKTSFFLN